MEYIILQRVNSLLFVHYLLHFIAFPLDIHISAYNFLFATQLAKQHPNMWSCIQLNQSAHVHFEHISITISAGASAPKQSTKTKAFQRDMSGTVILVLVPVKKNLVPMPGLLCPFLFSTEIRHWIPQLSQEED
jgi:hypothetical protein